MNTDSQDVDADDGDPTRRQLDVLRHGGPVALAELLGDQSYLLAELALEPGAMFALDGPERLSAHYSAVVGRLHEQRSALEALEARAIVSLAESIRRETHAQEAANAAQEITAMAPEAILDKRAERAATREISMITHRSPSGAGRTLGSCRRMVESMPEMFEAIVTGQVTFEKVHSAAASVAPLSPEQRQQVDRGLAKRLPALDGAGTKRWKREVARQIEAADPQGEARRHQYARTRRHVTVRPGEHGMATVSARLPSLDAALIRKRLSLDAEKLRAQGDRRGHQAIQADIFVDTLLGRETGMAPMTLDIGVIITDRALFTPSQGDIAHIEGYGPVPSESLREELRAALSSKKNVMDEALGEDGPAVRAELRRLYTHPTTGELVAMESTARAFPPALARFILWRDVTCRGPFCDAPIRQTDHIKPYSEGGHTCLDNGDGDCVFCNDKEQQTRSVERDDAPETQGHSVTWTSVNGVTRTTTPEPLGPSEEAVSPPMASGGQDSSRASDTSTPPDESTATNRSTASTKSPASNRSTPSDREAPAGGPRRYRRVRQIRASRRRGDTRTRTRVSKRRRVPRRSSRGRGPTQGRGRGSTQDEGRESV
ncbi:MAG: DUF222 domain-containing protein [Brachybacterium tyrofermentans]|uniref:DUF222 domain-containing protein n=1 Tax=Brachybacterium tyrofermentans TaxID=47848 RepID=A0ABW0FBU3_9MICO|nr:DUF222 domain-containing protein [Brachybacterium tyrofermentans]